MPSGEKGVEVSSHISQLLVRRHFLTGFLGLGEEQEIRDFEGPRSSFRVAMRLGKNLPNPRELSVHLAPRVITGARVGLILRGGELQDLVLRKPERDYAG